MHGLDMRDTYINSIKMTFFCLFLKQKMNRIR